MVRNELSSNVIMSRKLNFDSVLFDKDLPEAVVVNIGELALDARS